MSVPGHSTACQCEECEPRTDYKAEIERLRAALEEIAKVSCFTEANRWAIRDIARKALAKEEGK